MSESEEKTLELAAESRQTHLKIFIRVVAVVDMVHIIFPICFFGNLAVTAAFTWIGPVNDARQRSLIYFAPVGVVSIVILSYGIPIAIRLFNCSDPDMRPSKSAKMALCWWHYTLFLLVFEVIASAYYYFVSYAQNDILGFLFSFMLNFSIAIKNVSLYLVRKFIREMRNIEIRVVPAESRNIVQRTPLFLQKQQQMRLLTKAVAIVDLIQNSFMLLSIVYVCVQNALHLQEMSSERLGYGITLIIFILLMIGVFYYALHVGFKLFKAADKIVDVQHLHEMPPDIQLGYNKTFRNWLLASLACIIFVEIDCLLLAVFRGDITSVFYIGALSLSFGIRAVSIYFIRRFKKDFWKKREEGDMLMDTDSTNAGLEGSHGVRQSVVSFKAVAQLSQSESSQSQVSSQPSETSESVSSQKLKPVGILTAQKSQPSPLPQLDKPKSSDPVPKPAPALPLPQPSQPQPPGPSSQGLPRPTSTQYFRSLVEQKDSQSSLFLWEDTET